jgi:hypothetical protein
MLHLQTKSDDDRQWIVANQQLPGASWEAAEAARNAIVSDLRAQGWGITGTSVGSCYITRGDLFTGHEVLVTGERGHGPNTAYELEMQRTCTGRD